MSTNYKVVRNFYNGEKMLVISSDNKEEVMDVLHDELGIFWEYRIDEKPYPYAIVSIQLLVDNVVRNERVWHFE